MDGRRDQAVRRHSVGKRAPKLCFLQGLDYFWTHILIIFESLVQFGPPPVPHRAFNGQPTNEKPRGVDAGVKYVKYMVVSGLLVAQRWKE